MPGRKTILTLMFCGLAALSACGRSPTAPAAPQAAVQNAQRTVAGASASLQSSREREAVRGERRGRSKYSVIFF